MALIIGVSGSPRKNGNSNTLMRVILRGAASKGADVGEVSLNDLTYRGCQGCRNCVGGGGCIVTDELTPVLAKLWKADGWILAAPIYYDGVSGQLKMFFDRCRTFTRDPVSHELDPQLEGVRRAVIVVTYADSQREDYRRAAEVLAGYLAWMGDFGDVEKLVKGDLGPADAARRRRDLIERAELLGGAVFG